MNIRPQTRGGTTWFEDHSIYTVDTTIIAAIDSTLQDNTLFPYTNDSNIDLQHASGKFECLAGNVTIVAGTRICLGVFLQPNYEIGQGSLLYNFSGGLWLRGETNATIKVMCYPVFGRIDGDSVGVGSANIADNASENWIPLPFVPSIVPATASTAQGFATAWREMIVGYIDPDLLNDVQANITDLNRPWFAGIVIQNNASSNETTLKFEAYLDLRNNYDEVSVFSPSGY